MQRLLSSNIRRSRILFAALLLILATSTAFANPPSRSSSRLVFDAEEGRSLLFGGMTKPDASGIRYYLNDTWVWTGTHWIQLFPANSPSGRAAHAMAYDAHLAEMVLFGGLTGTDTDAGKPIVTGDTWVYHDRNWFRVNTTNAPSAREFAAAAYDPNLQKVVLFGGYDATSWVHDTWTFDGANWTLLSSGSPALLNPMMVFDKKRNELYLLGWNSSNATEMYKRNGNGWDRVTPANLPACINIGSVTYNETVEKVQLLTGQCATGLAGDETWQWDGSDWTKLDLTSKTHPNADWGHSFVYDPIRGVSVLFGGVTRNEVNSTLLFNGSAWQFVYDDYAPGPRSLMVFEGDPNSGVSWMYGGHDDAGDFNDLWRYRSGKWDRVGTTGMPATCAYPIGAYDTERKKLVIACEDSSVQEWDGQEWKSLDPKTKPGIRWFSSLAYDQNLKKTLLYGGYDGVNYLRETWSWDGTDWKRLTKDSGPSNRGLASMFYDPTSQKTLVYGGIGRPTTADRIVRYGDLWSFDGTKWTEMKTVTNPPPRYGAETVFDPTSNSTLLVGGKNEQEQYIAEVWRWNGTAWTNISPSGAFSPRMNIGLAFDTGTNRVTIFGGYSGFFYSELWTLESGDTWVRHPLDTTRRRSIRNVTVPGSGARTNVEERQNDRF